MAGSSGDKDNSAFNKVEIEVEADLGNTILAAPGAVPHSLQRHTTVKSKIAAKGSGKFKNATSGA